MSLNRICRFAQVAVLMTVATFGAGCTNTLFYGESTEFDLAIHFNDNPQQPLEVNIGLKRHVGQVTPPVATSQNESGTAAVGEAVSTLSGFRLRYEEDATGGPLNNDLYIRTQFATGAAAATLAKNPIQAVKVMNADFERDASFVAPEAQARVSKILDGIKTLDDGKALALACNPPVKSGTMSELIAARDPSCQRATNAEAARQILLMQAGLDDRTEANLKAWEDALGLP
ncbi:MAG: hypothetical protein C0484_27415 [Rhodospirillum sp.]|nr:hypothetical protein [Rhodospirillum sp.]